MIPSTVCQGFSRQLKSRSYRRDNQDEVEKTKKKNKKGSDKGAMMAYFLSKETLDNVTGCLDDKEASIRACKEDLGN